MGGFCNNTPHFFQPLIPDFQSNFSIPKAFLNKYLDKEDVDGKIATIISSKKTDKIWKVKMGFNDDDGNNKLHFKNGWKKFCEDYGLQLGDFLVFMLHQNLVFDVFVFDPSSCERPFPGDHHHHPTNSSKKVDLLSAKNVSSEKVQEGMKRTIKDKKACSKAKVNFKPRGYPYYHTTLKPYFLRLGVMLLPMEFARENGLTNKRCEITIIDQEGEEYQLTLKHNKKACSVYIGKWKMFHKSHSLKAHDPVVFELIDSGKNPIFKFYKLS